jgi:hypothetical protein
MLLYSGISSVSTEVRKLPKRFGYVLSSVPYGSLLAPMTYHTYSHAFNLNTEDLNTGAPFIELIQLVV